jgi:23S rRNA (adenine2503-C2)-methyltransferase
MRSCGCSAVESQSVAADSSAIDSRKITKETSLDGSRKYAFHLPGGLHAEAAFFRVAGRIRPNIACVSTQLGCSVGCIFCATATQPFYRNLTAEEILWQVDAVALDQDLPRILTEGFEISFMGMGEPLANLPHVLQAIHWISRGYPAISRVSISTSGPAARIDRLTEAMPASTPIHLQVSLHATKDSDRSEIVPRAPSTIADLLRAATRYHEKTGDQVCLNYVLMDGRNDSTSDASWLSGLDPAAFEVKLSALNLIPGLPATIQKTSREATVRFADQVAARGMTVRIFEGDGLDVGASCGQLAATPRLVAIIG